MFARFTLLSLFLLFSQLQEASAEPQNWVIGMPVCLSGDCAADGQSALNGAELAAEEINQSGGVLGRQIEIRAEDTAEATSGARAVTAFKKLRADERIKFFVGPSWTPGGLALAPLVARDLSILMITPSLGASEFHKAGANIFNSRGVDEAGSRALAKYALSKGWKRAVVLSSQQPWELAQGRFFVDEFKSNGGEVLALYEPLPSMTDLRTEATKTAALKPDFVFLSSVVQLSSYARSLRVLGFHAPKLGAYVDEPRIQAANGALEGIVAADLLAPSEDFVVKYKNRFKAETMPLPASTAYDTINLLASLAKESGSFEVAQLRDGLLKQEYEGVSGRIKFDEQGSAIRVPFLKKLVGSDFVTVKGGEL